MNLKATRLHLIAIVILASICTAHQGTTAEPKTVAKKKEPSVEASAEVSQAEARKKYPELGKAGSEFNKMFAERVKTLRAEKSDIFKDSKWPLKIADEIAAHVKKLNVRTFDPADSGPLNPLWAVTSDVILEKTEEPAKGYAAYLGASRNGNAIFIASKLNAPMSLVSIAADSGKLLWRTPFKDQPEGTQEFWSTEYFTSEGNVVICTVSYRFDPEDKAAGNSRHRLARIHLRVFDGTTGKLLSHAPLTYDDPTTATESKPIYWSAQKNTWVGRTGGKNALVNGYFFAELDSTFTKVENVVRFPKRVREPAFFGPGALANDSQFSGQVWTAMVGGKDAQEITPPQPGWKITQVRDLEGRYLTAVCSDPEQHGRILCGYDTATKTWTWTKKETDPTVAKAGPIAEVETWWDAKTLNQSKRTDTLILDGASGEVRFRIPTGVRYEMQPEGKAWVFPQGEIHFLNCTNGEIEARFSRIRGLPPRFSGQGDLVYLPKDRLMIVDVVGGGLEVSVVDASNKVLSAPRKVAVDMPTAVTGVSSYPSESACVLMLRSAQGTSVFCAIPLPR